MSRKETYENRTWDLLLPIAEELGITPVDVEYLKEAGEYYLRVFIDKEGGVGLDDCQAVSEKAGAILDEKDLIPDNYMLEVSSPGLDRVLKKDKDFIRYTGEDVDVKLVAPLEGTKTKSFTAKLEGLAEDGALLLEMESGDKLTLGRDKISQVRLHFFFFL